MRRQYKIIHNRIRCLRCGEILESVNRHDFVACQCFLKSGGTEGVANDGGIDYLRRVGNPEDFEDLSETRLYTDEERDKYDRRQMEFAEKYGFSLELME